MLWGDIIIETNKKLFEAFNRVPAGLLYVGIYKYFEPKFGTHIKLICIVYCCTRFLLCHRHCVATSH